MSERMLEMVRTYGEICQQQTAAKILSVSTKTIWRLMDEGNLRRVGRKVDVRSICEYIENPMKKRRRKNGLPIIQTKK